MMLSARQARATTAHTKEWDLGCIFPNAILMNWAIELTWKANRESEPGKGTRFTIFLPVEKNPEKNHQETLATAETTIVVKENGSRLPKVLYVEDDPDHREFVSAFMKGKYEVHLAEDGPLGVLMASAIHFDAILMDINLGPRMNGLETVKEIREISGYENTPIAAVTANAMITQKAEYLAGGCSHFISKPFNKRKLLDFLEKMMG